MIKSNSVIVIYCSRFYSLKIIMLKMPKANLCSFSLFVWWVWFWETKMILIFCLLCVELSH